MTLRRHFYLTYLAQELRQLAIITQKKEPFTPIAGKKYLFKKT